MTIRDRRSGRCGARGGGARPSGSVAPREWQHYADPLFATVFAAIYPFDRGFVTISTATQAAIRARRARCRRRTDTGGRLTVRGVAKATDSKVPPVSAGSATRRFAIRSRFSGRNYIPELVLMNNMYDWLLTWGEVISGLGSVLFSAILAVLYFKMSRTQEERTEIIDNQHEIMESQNESMIAAGIGDDDFHPMLVLENVGGRAAINVTVDWTIGDQEMYWTNPIVSSGERIELSLYGEEYKGIGEAYEETGEDVDIIIEITHRTPTHKKRTQEWTFNLSDELSRLTEYVDEKSDQSHYDQGRELKRIADEIKNLRR